ncbi:hypothetical protein [Alcaligenes faecalis]|uniref:DUF192 domain-containing protein n=1 Tax=Alcaligenes faecalis TaxID=511 RepID=A0AAE9KRH5_ALCFA|nr:hypothetical protein [Alcaligenes faecalis]UPL23001.1 hypothetical protein MXF72_07975 [Alcaligenes faecalis]
MSISVLIKQPLQQVPQQPLYLFDANTFWARWRGWKALPQNKSFAVAVWLRPCRAVHLWGMRQALDICFLDERDQPLRFCPAVPAGAIRWHRQARSVLEAPVTFLSGPEQFSPWAAALQEIRQTGGGVWLDRA